MSRRTCSRRTCKESHWYSHLVSYKEHLYVKKHRAEQENNLREETIEALIDPESYLERRRKFWKNPQEEAIEQ